MIRRSPRRVLAWARSLPPESAFARSYTDGIPWGTEAELLATVAELQHVTVRVLLSAFGAKQIPDVLEITRPGHSSSSVEAQARTATVEDVFDTLGSMLTVNRGG